MLQLYKNFIKITINKKKIRKFPINAFKKVPMAVWKWIEGIFYENKSLSSYNFQYFDLLY